MRCIGTTNVLHQACKQGNLDIVKKILSAEYVSHRPDISGKDSYGSTALHEASYAGHDEIVRLLIQAECNVLVRDASGATALHRVSTLLQQKVRLETNRITLGGDRQSCVHVTSVDQRRLARLRGT